DRTRATAIGIEGFDVPGRAAGSAGMRADQLLVVRGLATSRARARELIEAGAVRVRLDGEERTLHKPSSELAGDAAITVLPGATLRYVSRAGIKLEGALVRSAIDARGLVCLDLGQSTGGFTDCLLQAG